MSLLLPVQSTVLFDRGGTEARGEAQTQASRPRGTALPGSFGFGVPLPQIIIDEEADFVSLHPDGVARVV